MSGKSRETFEAVLWHVGLGPEAPWWRKKGYRVRVNLISHIGWLVHRATFQTPLERWGVRFYALTLFAHKAG